MNSNNIKRSFKAFFSSKPVKVVFYVGIAIGGFYAFGAILQAATFALTSFRGLMSAFTA